MLSRICTSTRSTRRRSGRAHGFAQQALPHSALSLPQKAGVSSRLESTSRTAREAASAETSHFRQFDKTNGNDGGRGRGTGDLRGAAQRKWAHMCLRPSRPLRPVQASSQGLTDGGGAPSPLLSPLALDRGARGAGVVGGRFSPGLPARSASAPAEFHRFSCAPGGRSHTPGGVRGYNLGVYDQEDLGARARMRELSSRWKGFIR